MILLPVQTSAEGVDVGIVGVSLNIGRAIARAQDLAPVRFVASLFSFTFLICWVVGPVVSKRVG